MGARYVWRMDDVSPGMDWARFWSFVNLFRQYRVVPLLGVVPDNRDPDLSRSRDDPRLWERLRQLHVEGAVDVAQHGYQHLALSRASGAVTRRTEFAGLPYPEQLQKIRLGQEKLRENGIRTDIWMAPFHSFDDVTLQALVDSGFRCVSDGRGLYPFKRRGLVFVPQQLWRPRRMPFGVFTICLHTSDGDDQVYGSVQAFLRSGTRSIRFTEAAAMAGGGMGRSAANVAFGQALRLLRALRRTGAYASSVLKRSR